MSFRFDCFVLIPDMTQSHVLLMPQEQEQDARWTLPHFVFTEDHFGVVSHVNRTVRERLGIDTTVLRCVSYQVDPDRISCTYVMETHVQTSPRQGQWVGRARLAALLLARGEERVCLDQWLAETENMEAGEKQHNEEARSSTPIPPTRPAYCRLGWYDRALTWAGSQLAQAGIKMTGPVEQLRLWQRCCLLRLPTDQGALYLKAVPTPSAHEPAITLALAQYFPDNLPFVLATDSRRGLLLSADFGGASLEQVGDIAIWEQAVRQFAKLQIGCLDCIGRKADGILCSDRRLNVLAGQIGPLLADVADASLPFLLPGCEDRFRAVCDALAEYDLPATLCHGDLWAGNIAITGAGPMFFDWADASFSHPFFDLFWLLQGIEERFPAESEGVRNRLQDAYLEAWTRFAPMERLHHAFSLAQPLAALHHALTYSQYLLPYVEQDWEMADLIPFFLEMADKEMQKIQG